MAVTRERTGASTFLAAVPIGLRRVVIATAGSPGDVAFRAFTLLCALVILAAVVAIAGMLLVRSNLAFARFGWGFLTSQSWDPVSQRFGVLPFLYGTVVTSIVALLLAAPVGLAVAIFLVEICPRPLQAPLAFLAELLAAIPSVVYGLWGIFVLAPVLRSVVEPALGHALGFLPIFRGAPYGVGLLAGSCILAIMITPTVVAIAREVLAAVPDAQRQAAYALGATRWEVIWSAVLPYGLSGIVGAIVLALGRAVGETMAVTMVIGNNHTISASVFGLGATLPSVLANEFAEASTPLYISTLMEVALVLFGLTIVLNVAARLLVAGIARGRTAKVAA